jgi:hypothetical protein
MTNEWWILVIAGMTNGWWILVIAGMINGGGFN